MDEITVIKAEQTDLIQSSSFMPETFANRYKMAEVLAKSGLMPNGMNSPEKVVVALQYGYELGLSPMVAVNNIAVVNGKPTLSTDCMHAVVRKAKEYGGLEWVELTDKRAECIVHRISSNYKEDVRGVYTIEDAKNAGLLNKDNWKNYPGRMLKHRALSYALRDAFPDVLTGIYQPEEMEDVKPEVRNITPPEEQKTEELVDQVFKANKNKIKPAGYEAPETNKEEIF